MAHLWQLSPESQVGPMVIFCHVEGWGRIVACTLACHCARSLAAFLLTVYSTQVRPPGCNWWWVPFQNVTSEEPSAC